MSWLQATVAGLCFGFGSALVPLFNAEAFLVGSAASDHWLVLPIILTLAAGQTVGKLVLFEAARRGSLRFAAAPRLRSLSSGRWAARIHDALQRPRTALPLVFT